MRCARCARPQRIVPRSNKAPGTGLVTLTGPGGTGKTRLATHIANTLGPSFEGGAFYVPLAGVRNVRDVMPTIVSVLEIPAPSSGGDPERLLLGFLRARRALGQGIVGVGPARQQHRRADHEQHGEQPGVRTGHRRAHQNEVRLSALAIEIVKIPTYVSRRMPRSPVRSIGRA